jgi:ribosomal protein S18 acetylase RimI-like enzyme
MIELPQNICRSVSKHLDIRNARPADFYGVLGVLSQMHEDAAFDETLSKDAFREILSSPSRTVLVAVNSETVVAALDLFVMANMTRGGRPWAGIENLVVDAEHRRAGIGKALMEVAVDLAQEQNCYKLQLVSHERRSAAHDLYRQIGFDAPVHGYRRYL